MFTHDLHKPGERVEFERVYVHVLADHHPDGDVTPHILYWPNEDGVEIPYEIDKASKGRPAHARKAGGQGLLYEIRINGHTKNLFYDGFERRFFVEKEIVTTRKIH